MHTSTGARTHTHMRMHVCAHAYTLACMHAHIFTHARSLTRFLTHSLTPDTEAKHVMFWSTFTWTTPTHPLAGQKPNNSNVNTKDLYETKQLPTDHAHSAFENTHLHIIMDDPPQFVEKPTVLGLASEKEADGRVENVRVNCVGDVLLGLGKALQHKRSQPAKRQRRRLISHCQLESCTNCSFSASFSSISCPTSTLWRPFHCMLGYLGIFITHERERTRERVDRCLCECRCVASVAVKHFVLQPNAENRALYKKR